MFAVAAVDLAHKGAHTEGLRHEGRLGLRGQPQVPLADQSRNDVHGEGRAALTLALALPFPRLALVPIGRTAVSTTAATSTSTSGSTSSTTVPKVSALSMRVATCPCAPTSG